MVSANVSIADSKVRSSSMTKPWEKPQVIINDAIYTWKITENLLGSNMKILDQYQ